MPNALGSAARLYRPVQHGQVSQTLFIGNTGPVVGVKAQDIERYCSEFGAVCVDVPDETKSFVFCTFDSTEEAERAHKRLSLQNPWGRAICVKFAELSPKYKVRRTSGTWWGMNTMRRSCGKPAAAPWAWGAMQNSG